MNLPTLIERIYGDFVFTGLYSFEFVDKNRNTITEIFFMVPPKTKNLSESTRSSTVPTLGGNYNLDAGNATKDMVISGKLYFPYVGSPDNPVARDNAGLQNSIDGLNEFFKLQFMLVRYRDYTLTDNAEVTVPSSVIALSPETFTLYKKVSKLVNGKFGALYDEIQLIVHDYDMDDHFYCRVENFSSTQSDSAHLAIDYTINVECYRPDTGQRKGPPEVKLTSNASSDSINTEMQDVDFSGSLEQIQNEISYNTGFLNTALTIESLVSDINDENESIQSGKSTVLDNMPQLISQLFTAVDSTQSSFLEVFLTPTQQALYDTGDLNIDSVANRDLVSFYNSTQKIKIQTESYNGLINSIVKQESIRYYADANDYKLTEEQFDEDGSNRTEAQTNFYYYTILEGDTSTMIAQRELKDYTKFVTILKLNDLSENDFIDGSLVGTKIKIPIEADVIVRGADNLVYESDFTDVNKFLYGIDLKLNTNKKLVVSGKGDLGSVVGIENVYQNIENRLQNRKGSLNVFNPNWGTIAIDDGNSPIMVKVERYITDVISQIQADPRVESVRLDLDKLSFKGEVVEITSIIFFVGSEETREVTV